MSKKIVGILLGVLIVFTVVFNFHKQGEPQGEAKGEPSINLAEAGGIVAENPDFAFDVSVYKEDVDDMRMATLSPEEKKTRIIN